jgi:hypothetical protein
MAVFIRHHRANFMSDTFAPLTIEHEGSKITIDSTGLSFSGPTIRINSGEPPAGSKVFQIGKMQVALDASGVSLNGCEIRLPASRHVEGMSW